MFACRRRHPLLVLRRRLTSNDQLVYDSQSGQYIDLRIVPRIYNFSGCVTITSPQDVEVVRGWRRIVRIEDLSDSSSGGVSYEATERKAAAAIAEAARDLGLEQHAVIKREDYSGGDLLSLQLLAADLADRGARSIVVEIDEDFEDVVDILSEVDLEGLPMRRRIGFRGREGLLREEQVDAALGMGITTFDALQGSTVEMLLDKVLTSTRNRIQLVNFASEARSKQ